MDRFAHIAIDGPAGSGKTTVARALARRLDILYLDTGAMYRAVALLALRAGTDPADPDSTVRLATEHPIRAVRDHGSEHGYCVFAGDTELGNELYDPRVSRIVSIVAAQPAIRDLMVRRQRAAAAEGPVIMAGRDIGTVVLPDAPVKVFLTASLDERVERRLVELAERGNAMDRDALRAEIAERDRLDEGRETAPLRPADDAVELDSTGMTIDEVVDRIVALAEEAGAR